MAIDAVEVETGDGATADKSEFESVRHGMGPRSVERLQIVDDCRIMIDNMQILEALSIVIVHDHIYFSPCLMPV